MIAELYTVISVWGMGALLGYFIRAQYGHPVSFKTAFMAFALSAIGLCLHCACSGNEEDGEDR